MRWGDRIERIGVVIAGYLYRRHLRDVIIGTVCRGGLRYGEGRDECDQASKGTLQQRRGHGVM
ncbi:hypothetical protein GCM10027288_22440 [Bordetella tumbae]